TVTGVQTCALPILRGHDREHFFLQAQDGIRGLTVTGVQTCALPIWRGHDLERLSALVLAVVASPQVKKDRRGARELHPVLSSMVRVADGLRLTAHQMLFIPGREPARLPSSRVTAAEILAYAERHDAFHSAQGVRAAP